MRMIRLPELIKMLGLSRETIFRMERDGRFPRRRKISKQAMGWISTEVEDWLKALPVTPKGANPAKQAAEEEIDKGVCPRCGGRTEVVGADERWTVCKDHCGFAEAL